VPQRDGGEIQQSGCCRETEKVPDVVFVAFQWLRELKQYKHHEQPRPNLIKRGTDFCFLKTPKLALSPLPPASYSMGIGAVLSASVIVAVT
jgi:hypothetical protein